MSGPEDTRRKIIDAALELFSQQGYSRTPTRGIADKAGVNEVTLFRHFGNKQNLLYACMETTNQRGFAQTFEDHLTGDYATDIRIMGKLQMENTLDNFDMLRLALCDAQVMPDLRQAMQQGASGNLALMVAYFQRQIDAGIIRADLDATVVTHAFDSLFSSSTLIQNILGHNPLDSLSQDEVIDALATIFIRGTRNTKQ